MDKDLFYSLLIKIENYEDYFLKNIIIDSDLYSNIKNIGFINAYINKCFFDYKNQNISNEQLIKNSSHLFYYLFLLVKKFGANQKLNIFQFKELIFLELKNNSEKGDFFNWNPNSYYLFAEISYHLSKLYKSIFDLQDTNSQNYNYNHSQKELSEFSCDVCNYMIKLTQQY